MNVTSNLKNSQDEKNRSQYVLDLMSIPIWIPSSMIGVILNCNATLEDVDLKKFDSEILLTSKFYCTSSSSMKKAAIFRGNFLLDATSNAASIGFDEMTRKLEESKPLKNRIQLFLV